MSLRSPASASSPSSCHKYFFPDHASTSSGSPHVCLSPLPVDDDEEFEYPYPYNRVHLRSRPSSLKLHRRSRSRASSISSMTSIVSVCSDQSDNDDIDDANSIFSDVECTSTHTSCSSARDEVDEGKRRAFNSVMKTSTFPALTAPRLRPRGPRPLPQIPTRAAPASASRSHARVDEPPRASVIENTNATTQATKPRIVISLDPNFCVPYVERDEDDPYSATNSPSNTLITLALKAVDFKTSPPSSPLSPSSDLDSPISPRANDNELSKKPRIRYADTLMREEDAEFSPLDVLFNGVAEDDVIDWDRIEEFMHAWDGSGVGCGDGYGLGELEHGGREVRCHR